MLHHRHTAKEMHSEFSHLRLRRPRIPVQLQREGPRIDGLRKLIRRSSEFAPLAFLFLRCCLHLTYPKTLPVFICAVLQSAKRYSTTSQSAWNCPICTVTRSPGLTRRPLLEKAIQ
jgi:hypothetical protein